MELTFAKCETILNTLPIGYYTGRRIGTSLDPKAETSFYSPTEDVIVVSYPIIAQRLKALPDTADDEEAVRSMLYHEVSHAILTPTSLRPDASINIFEDERIESVLRNYYHNVDFRKQLYDLHGGHPPKATDAESAFYNAVRFGLGGGAVQQEINRIMKKYATMNRATPEYSYSSRIINSSDYTYEVHDLYRRIAREFKDNPDAFQPQAGQEGQQGQGMDKLQAGNGDGEKGEEKRVNGTPDGDGEESQEMPDMIGDAEHEIEASAEQVKRMVGASLGKAPTLKPEEQKKLAEFQKSAEMIIGNFNKKNAGGSGINAYSGVFNPRAVVRKDYRYFERAMTTQGNNKYGTCHLNLIIDCSGSFCNNVDLTNGILASLSEIERKNRNFTMDVSFINHTFQKCNSIRDRQMSAWGGNSIPENMKQILMEMQKPQTCNYNIVLFDGDAMCNNRDCRSDAQYRQRFKVFDMKQTTLITDPENQRYMGNGFTSTKVVVTHDYTKELIQHILNALTIAFG